MLEVHSGLQKLFKDLVGSICRPAALGIDGSTTATDIHPGAATAGDASRPAPSQVRYEAAAAVGELEYVRRAVLRAPASSSAWGYLGALLQLPGGAAALVHDDRIPALCSEVHLQMTMRAR